MDGVLRKPNLLSWSMIGGLSLIVWPLLVFFPPSSIATLPFLIFVFSLPHFTLSYFLFYSQRDLRRSHRLEGLYAPLGLLAILGFAVSNQAALPYLLQAAWIFFFYHVARQSAGVVLFYSPKTHPAYAVWKKLVQLTTLLIASAGWCAAQNVKGPLVVFKGAFAPMAGAVAVTPYVVAAAIISGFSLVTFAIRRRLFSSLTQNVMGWTPLLAQVTWSIPLLGLASYVPILHGMQYLPFAETKLRLDRWSVRSRWVIGLLTVAAGYALFESVPHALSLQSTNGTALVTTLYVFLNVHHFVIDRALWTRANFYLKFDRASSQPETYEINKAA